MAVLFSLELEKQLETQLTSGRASLTLQLIPPTNIVFGMRGRGSSIVISILPQHIRKDFAMKQLWLFIRLYTPNYSDPFLSTIHDTYDRYQVGNLCSCYLSSHTSDSDSTSAMPTSSPKN